MHLKRRQRRGVRETTVLETGAPLKIHRVLRVQRAGAKGGGENVRAEPLGGCSEDKDRMQCAGNFEQLEQALSCRSGSGHPVPRWWRRKAVPPGMHALLFWID